MKHKLGQHQLQLTLLGWFFIISILILPSVNNHTETEDAYMYARQLVQVDDWTQLIHPHHKIYHIICDEFYGFTNHLFGLDALNSLILISKICVILTLVFLNFFLLSLGIKPLKIMVLLAVLSVIYNFWRYAHAAEINAMAWCGYSFSMLLFVKAKSSMKWVPWLAISGCVATLIHTVNIVPVVIVFGTYFLLSRKFAAFIVYAVTLIVMTVSSFQILDHYTQEKTRSIKYLEEKVTGQSSDQQKFQQRESMRKIDFKSVEKSVVGLGVSVLGVNIVMGYDQVYYPLKQSLFKERYLFEERFMAEGLSLWHRVLWIFMLVCLIVVVVWILLRIYRQIKLDHKEGWNLIGWIRQRPLEVSIGVGGAACVLFVLWFEPGNPEMWALLLPSMMLPMLLILNVVSMSPLVVLYGVLGVTNWTGGMSLLQDKEKDYFFASITPLLDHSKVGDVLLKARVHSGISRYSNYYYPDVKVGALYLDDDLPRRFGIIRANLSQGHRVFVHREVIEREHGFGLGLSEQGLKFIPIGDFGGELQLL